VLWWIAGGVVALALVSLLVVLLVLAGHLRRFAGVAMTLNTRIGDGQQRLQPRLLDLQKKAEALQEKTVASQEKAAALQTRRGDPDNS
jgi:hypothetical protein